MGRGARGGGRERDESKIELCYVPAPAPQEECDRCVLQTCASENWESGLSFTTEFSLHV